MPFNIIPVEPGHPWYEKLTPQFKALGTVVEAAGLAWSERVPKELKQADASVFCSSLGEGARLPTREDYLRLTRTVGAKTPEIGDFDGYQGRFLAYLFSGMPGQKVAVKYWSSSTSKDGKWARLFDTRTGRFTWAERGALFSVRCVY